MSLRRAVVLHADLLRALDCAQGDPATERRLAARLGFELRPDESAAAIVADRPERPGRRGGATSPPSPPAVPTGDGRAPLRAELAAITEVRLVHAPQPEPAPSLVSPLTAADCAPLPGATPPEPKPLQQRTRLWPALRLSASDPHAAGVDIARLVRQLTRGKHLRRLPQRQRSSWAGTLWVLQDESERLAPFQRDFDAIVDELLRLRGADGLTLWRFRDRPDRPHGCDTARTAVRWRLPLPTPAPGMRLLLLSDLGALAPESEIEQQWAGHLDRWRQAGARVQAWLPGTPRQVPQALARRAALHCLGAAGRAGLRRQRGAWSTPEQRRAEHARLTALLETLQVHTSCAVHLSVDVLRDLRLGSPELAAEPALEALHWISPDARRSHESRALMPAAAATRRQAFGALPIDRQVQILATLQAHHASHGRSTGATEALLWRSHASPAAATQAPAAEAVDAAERWWQGFEAAAANVGPTAAGARAFARDVLQRHADDAAWQRRCERWVATLAACAGDDLPPPGHVSAQALLRARVRLQRQPAAGAVWRLLQRGAQLWAWPAEAPLPPHASALDGGRYRASSVVVTPADGPRRVLALPPEGRALAALRRDDTPIKLGVDDADVTVALLSRPAWAAEWGRDAEGLYALAPSPWGDRALLEPVPQPVEATATAAALQWAQPASGRRAAGNRTALPGRVAVVHAHADEPWRARVVDVLHNGLGPGADVWSYKSLGAGEYWVRAIQQALSEAQLVLVLLSRSSNSSAWLLKGELPGLLDAHRRGNLRLLPVRLQQPADTGLIDLDTMRAFDWGGTPLAELPPDEQDFALHALAVEVQEQLEEITDRRARSGYIAHPANQQPLRWFELGAEPAFGLYADLTIQDVTQRFRWLPPGEFWMGSPDDEAERFDDEGPRHRVRLTEGLWLADTACTQALWRAVMEGDNPSSFSDDPQNPVESVSWDDVQAFLQRLQPLLPRGCTAALPTEAEWEYACRAGTETPFSFGDNITPEQVNYDGNHPYVGAEEGQYRQRTVPVKSLPANAWGLHQMHGNVWEWCADGADGVGEPGRYPPQAEGELRENPARPAEQGPEALRALRGGSWIAGARNARSANRYALRRDVRFVSVGFRLALRSSSISTSTVLAPEAPGGGAALPSPEGEAAPGGEPAASRLWQRALSALGLGPGTPPAQADNGRTGRKTGRKAR